MFLDIRPKKNDYPIYEQIVSQVIFGIASGLYEPGTLIPSVRELALQLQVHPNTVARAFQELERLEVVESKRGRGMEVTARAPVICSAKRQEKIRERIRDVLREAVASALPADEIEQLVADELRRVNGKPLR